MALGWWTAKKKAFRIAAARGLIANETKEVVPYLKQGLELAKSDEALKGLFISRLEDLGESVSGADELQGKDLDALAAYAKGKLNKRQMDKINKWWPPALNNLEVDVGLLQWALFMAQTSDSDELPRPTRNSVTRRRLACGIRWNPAKSKSNPGVII